MFAQMVPGLPGMGREIGIPSGFRPFRSVAVWIQTFEEGVRRLAHQREPLFSLAPEEMAEDTLVSFRDASGQEYAVHREGDKLRIWILSEE